MRFVALALLVCTILPAATEGAEPIQYAVRHNLFASADIPTTAIQQDPDTFVARRNGATTTITLDAFTPHVDEREADCRGGRLIHKLDKPRIFAYSCRIADEIFYAVTKYGKTSRVGASGATEEIGYTIRYPASQRAYWDSIVSRMTRSLRFDH